jgi:hypothetical protein
MSERVAQSGRQTRVNERGATWFAPFWFVARRTSVLSAQKVRLFEDYFLR